jgi:hypothetical protein
MSARDTREVPQRDHSGTIRVSGVITRRYRLAPTAEAPALAFHYGA